MAQTLHYGDGYVKCNVAKFVIMIKSFKSFLANESGATAIEYGLIASLIALVIISAVSVVGNNLSNTFNKISTNLH
jgi:pilus assembly protein Flp/PilA